MQIHGFGGCGQTAVMSAYGQKNIANSVADRDKLKHAPNISCPVQPSLYVYCHPELSAESHYRRGWNDLQSAKLNPKGSGVPRKYSDYLERTCKNQDGFGFLNNFRSWNACETVLPVTIEDFHDEEKIDQISRFTGVDTPSNFIKGRKSTLKGSCLDDTWATIQSEAAQKWASI